MPRPSTKPPTMARALTMSQAIEYSGLSRRTLYRYIAEGRLTKFYVGQRLRFSMDELDRLVSRTGRGVRSGFPVKGGAA